MAQVRSSRLGANRMIGGDFEDLATMDQAGWRHYQHPAPEIYTEAELAPQAAHTGRFGLRLMARAAVSDNPDMLVESSPVRLVGPDIQVEVGQILQIRGRVNVPVPIRGSVDGLMIFDSIAGEPLALRFSRTDGWQEFTLYRVATQSGHMAMTFVLTGLGEAWLDDVTVQPVERSHRQAVRP